MPRNRFDGSEAPDYPKGNGKVMCIQTDQACLDMLKKIAAIKSMTASQVVRELIRQEQRVQEVYISSYQTLDNFTRDLFE